MEFIDYNINMGRKKGSNHSEETKKRISDTLKQMYLTGERKPAKPMLGKSHSNKTKKKMKLSAIQRILDYPQTKPPDPTGRRLSINSRKKRSNPYSKTKKGYLNLHTWIKRNYGQSQECEYCHTNKDIQWANKSGKYIRERSDWMRLCRSCHRKYDIKNKLFNTYKDEY